MLAGGGAHQTAAQRGGEATKDKDRPLSDLQRERCAAPSVPAAWLPWWRAYTPVA